MIPRHGSPPDPARSYRRRPGAYAVLLRGDAVLLTFQEAPEPELQLPGGGIDPGESPLQALHREVMEETGWRIAAPRRTGAFRRFAFMPEYGFWAEKLCLAFVAHPVLCRGAPSEPGHHAAWVPAEAAIGLLGADGDAAMLTRVLLRAGARRAASALRARRAAARR